MLMVTLLSLALGSGIPQPAPLDPLAARQQLLTLEQRVDEARVNCDKQFLNQVEAGRFLFTDSQGATRNKPQDVTAPCRKSDVSVSIYDPRVELYGYTGVVADRETLWPAQGTSQPGESLRVTDVYAWHGGRWFLVARHESLLSGANKK
jgi:hypothetical protein